MTAPWPHAFQEARRWCFLKLTPGAEPLKALVESFLDTWQFGSTDPERVKQQNGWIELLSDGKGTLRDLLDATERRYKELGQTPPPPSCCMSIRARSFTCAPRSGSDAAFRKSWRKVLPTRASTH